MGIRVTNSQGKDVTNRSPREDKLSVYRCLGCAAEIHGPAGLASHPTDRGDCGPLNFERYLGRGETF